MRRSVRPLFEGTCHTKCQIDYVDVLAAAPAVNGRRLDVRHVFIHGFNGLMGASFHATEKADQAEEEFRINYAGTKCGDAFCSTHEIFIPPRQSRSRNG